MAAASADAPQSIIVRVADVRFLPATDELPVRCAAIIEELAPGDAATPPRRLPIWMGAFEGEYLALALEEVALPRPYMYRLTASLIHAAGARVREIRIDLLDGTVFRADVTIEGESGTASVDARASDGLNLAVLTQVPITIAAHLLAMRTAQEVDEPTRRADEWATLTGPESYGAAEVADRIRSSLGDSSATV